MKHTIVRAIMVGFASIMPLQAAAGAGVQLSVSEVITAIWKLNYEDTTLLHETVFPEEYEENEYSDETVASGCSDKRTVKKAKLHGSVGKARGWMSNLYKTVREKIYGKTVVTHVLDTFESATNAEREEIKKAIAGSYKEYIREINTAEGIGLVFFLPIMLIVLAQEQREHIKKIEAQRARLPVSSDTSVAC